MADDWTKTAMRDGELIAELLVKLKEAKVNIFANRSVTTTLLRWGIRQPRSRSSRKEAENSRYSPSTPLSWSGGSSSSPPCGYVDSYDATSHQISGSGSKDIASLRSAFSEQDIENKNSKRRKVSTYIYMDSKNHSQDITKTENRKEYGNFLLPDLNIMPCEENGDYYSTLGVETTLYGISLMR